MYKKLLLFTIVAFACGAAKAQSFTTVDINPGSGSSDPANITVVGSKIIFTANKANYGTELWISDGTTAGTTMVDDINPGASSSDPEDLFAYNGSCLFSADDGTNGVQLWISDGTSGGTKLVKIINPTGDADPTGFTLYNGMVYFSATDGTNGVQPWVTDGTTAGTKMLAAVNPGGSSSPYDFTVYSSKLYFVANDGTNGNQIWQTDGTTANTLLFTSMNPGSANPGNLTVFGAKLFFTIDDGTHGNELWSTLGTTLSTLLFDDINTTAPMTGSDAYSFKAVGSKLFFVADDGTGKGYEPWVSDGTAGGTALLNDCYSGASSSNPSWFFNFNNELVFEANDGTNGYEFWESDGTTPGTKLVDDINPGSNSSSAGWFCSVGNTLYLQATTDALGWELYAWQLGWDTVALIIPDVAPTSDPLGYAVVPVLLNNNTLVFTADYVGQGNELWFYNTGASAIKDNGTLPTVKVYPNPFTNTINIGGLTAGETYNVRVTDLSGREVMNEKQSAGGPTMSLPLHGIAAGMYLAEVTNSTGASSTIKLIKQ